MWRAGWLMVLVALLAAVISTGADGAAFGLVVAGCLLVGSSLGLDSLSTPPMAPRAVAPPVRGRWGALNSPADRVPSHGTHAYGQTFAIDLRYEPEGGAPPVGAGAGFAPPREFPGFGRTCSRRRMGASPRSTIARATTAAGRHRAPAPTCGSRLNSARRLVERGCCWATSSCSTSAARCMRVWPTFRAAPHRSSPDSVSLAANPSPAVATRATRASHTFTSSSWTVPVARSPPGSRSSSPPAGMANRRAIRASHVAGS